MLLTNNSYTPILTIHAHVDMVQTSDLPITPQLKDDWISSNNTSLGIGIALAITLLKYYNIEILLTNDEETTMQGAHFLALSPRSKILLNTDWISSKQIKIASNGGFCCQLDFPAQQIQISNEQTVNFTGIDQRVLDSKLSLQSQVLESIRQMDENDIISQIQTGSAPGKTMNSGVISVAELCNSGQIKSSISAGILNKILSEIEFQTIIDENSQLRQSVNLGQISLENEQLSLKLHIRADSNEKLHEIKQQLSETANKYDGKCKIYQNYNNKVDDILGCYKAIQNEVFNKFVSCFNDPELVFYEGGTEVAVLQEKLDMDVLAIGCQIENKHTSLERVNLQSIKEMLDITEKFIQSLI